MTYANPKNLRRGEYITAIKKAESKEILIHEGKQMRILSVALPIIYIEVYDAQKNSFRPTSYHPNTQEANIIRLHKNAVTPIG